MFSQSRSLVDPTSTGPAPRAISKTKEDARATASVALCHHHRRSATIAHAINCSRVPHLLVATLGRRFSFGSDCPLLRLNRRRPPIRLELAATFQLCAGAQPPPLGQSVSRGSASR
jgi:hypothetical protein